MMMFTRNDTGSDDIALKMIRGNLYWSLRTGRYRVCDYLAT